MILVKTKIIVAAAALVALSACSAMPFTGDPIVQPCPDYFILEEAASLTQFRDGPGRDLIDVEYQAEMRTIALGCLSDIDTDTRIGEMEVEIAPVVGVELGAAFNGQETTLETFIAVMNPEDKVLYREAISIPISFQGNLTRLIVKAPQTTVALPITPDVSSRYYRIYGGFALTPSQVDYNRKKIDEGLR